MTFWDFLDKFLYNMGMGMFWLIVIILVCYIIGQFDSGNSR